MGWRSVAAVAALAAACSTPHARDTQTGSGSAGSASASEASVIVDGAALKARVGAHVAVKGTARDAKISAALMVGSEVVYCLGVASWPSPVSGNIVTAHGMLAHTDEFVAKPGPHGEISQGTDDPVYVLRECQYDAP